MQAKGISNGTAAVVVELRSASVEIELNDGRRVVVGYELFESTGEVVASRSQIPLCLGWAMTPHKSQGLSLQQGTCVISGWGDIHQAYVALSRFTDLEKAVIHLPALSQLGEKFMKDPECLAMLRKLGLVRT